MNDWFKERGIYKRDLSMRRAMILHTEYGIPFDVMYPSQLSEGEGVFVR